MSKGHAEITPIVYTGYAFVCRRDHKPGGCDCHRAKKYRNTGNRHRKHKRGVK